MGVPELGMRGPVDAPFSKMVLSGRARFGLCDAHFACIVELWTALSYVYRVYAISSWSEGHHALYKYCSTDTMLQTRSCQSQPCAKIGEGLYGEDV